MAFAWALEPEALSAPSTHAAPAIVGPPGSVLPLPLVPLLELQAVRARAPVSASAANDAGRLIFTVVVSTRRRLST